MRLPDAKPWRWPRALTGVSKPLCRPRPRSGCGHALDLRRPRTAGGRPVERGRRRGDPRGRTAVPLDPARERRRRERLGEHPRERHGLREPLGDRARGVRAGTRGPRWPAHQSRRHRFGQGPLPEPDVRRPGDPRGRLYAVSPQTRPPPGRGRPGARRCRTRSNARPGGLRSRRDSPASLTGPRSEGPIFTPGRAISGHESGPGPRGALPRRPR